MVEDSESDSQGLVVGGVHGECRRTTCRYEAREKSIVCGGRKEVGGGSTAEQGVFSGSVKMARDSM